MLLENLKAKGKKRAHWLIVKRKVKINRAEPITIDGKELRLNETEE